jgi:lactate dehydrogenase-like 2-hydroxyacid dehydrogenase
MSWCAWSFRTLCARVDALRQNLPNVLVTPHQAFLTEEALCNSGATTVQNEPSVCI